MPRKRREWYPGAQYHIMCRGNHRADIYRDDEDRLVYLTILEEERHKYNLTMISYCLMSNHVHLEVEVDDNSPGIFMKLLNMKYAIYFNKKYHYIGHLFQGRYRSELIETDAQLLQTSKYIHLNPVRANMVERPEQYAWSSYRAYLGHIPLETPTIQAEERTLSLFSGPVTVTLAPEIILKYFKDKNAALYKEYVEYDLHLHANHVGADDRINDAKDDSVADLLSDSTQNTLKNTLRGSQQNPVADPVADPVAGPATDPAADPAADPVADPAADPVADPVAGPAKETAPDSTHHDDINDLKQPDKPGEEQK